MVRTTSKTRVQVNSSAKQTFASVEIRGSQEHIRLPEHLRPKTEGPTPHEKPRKERSRSRAEHTGEDKQGKKERAKKEAKIADAEDDERKMRREPTQIKIEDTEDTEEKLRLNKLQIEDNGSKDGETAKRENAKKKRRAGDGNAVEEIREPRDTREAREKFKDCPSTHKSSLMPASSVYPRSFTSSHY